MLFEGMQRTVLGGTLFSPAQRKRTMRREFVDATGGGHGLKQGRSSTVFLADLLHVLARQARRQLENEPAGRAIVKVEERVPGLPVALAAARDQLCFRFRTHGHLDALALTVRRRGLLNGGAPRPPDCARHNENANLLEKIIALSRLFPFLPQGWNPDAIGTRPAGPLARRICAAENSAPRHAGGHCHLTTPQTGLD